MPTYFARKAGNINAADVWATTPSGTAAPVTFASGDILIANSFAITVNVSTDLGSTGQVRNDTTGGASAGGGFTLSSGVTLTASIFAGTTATACVTWSSSAPNTASIVSLTINGGSSSNGVFVNGSGTLNITATSVNGNGPAINSRGIEISSVATSVNVTASTIKGGSSNGSSGLTNQGNANVNVTANAVGGDNVAGNASTAFGINNAQGGVLNLTGTATGGAIAAGANNVSTGTLTATRAKGNAYGPGNTSGLFATVGISNAALGVVEIEQLEYGTNGMSPTSGTGIRLKKANTNVAVFNYCDTAGAKTLIDATQNAAMPAASDVRSGVSYASGAATGSCAVPAASSVAFGVPVDATTGTAVLTGADVATAVWSAASRTITEGGITAADVWNAASRTITGGTVTTLTNAPSVPSAASIRAEIDSNSTQLAAIKSKTDALPASPAATGDIPTESEIAAEVWAKPTTELTITGSIGERAKNQSTVSTTGAQLAAALS